MTQVMCQEEWGCGCCYPVVTCSLEAGHEQYHWGWRPDCECSPVDLYAGKRSPDCPRGLHGRATIFSWGTEEGIDVDALARLDRESRSWS